MSVFFFYLSSCSSAKKADDTQYGPEPVQTSQQEVPAELPGPKPAVIDPESQYGPIVQPAITETGLTVIAGSNGEAPGVVLGAIRQIEQEGIIIKKIIGVDLSSVTAGVHVSAESQNKSDWNLTQIYRDLEKGEKKDLFKKLQKMFEGKIKGRTQTEFVVEKKQNGSWVTLETGSLFERLIPAIAGCGWVDEPNVECLSPTSKEQYLELAKKNTEALTLILQKEVPTERLENVFFLQTPEAGGSINSTSRPKHLVLGKRLIKSEVEKIKLWIKEVKEKQ